MNPQIDLSGLRDLHIPTEPSFWPLAYGWWVLLALVLLGIIALLVCWYLWQQRPVVYALKCQKQIAKEPDDFYFLKEISQLLKRVAIAAYGRPKIAPLSDQKWQDFLINVAPSIFTKDQAHLIAFAIYQPDKKISLSRDDFNRAVTLWIKKVFKNKKSS